MSKTQISSPSVDVLQDPPYVVGRPNILNRQLFLKRVNQILLAKTFTNNGDFVRALETAVCEKFAIPHCVAVANGTLGLELVMSALGIQGEVIVPSFTFVASVHAILRVGAKPVLCEIEKQTCGMDLLVLERMITENTSAILGVNIYGGMLNVTALEQLAAKYNLNLLFDSAHSLGCKWNREWCGTFGEAEVFSLHATKFINGFEGGLITTKDAELARACRLASNFGFVGYDDVQGLGTNAKLSEIHAAMALTNFEYLEEIIAINKANFEWYKEYLPTSISLLEFDDRIESNYQYVVVFVPSNCRDKVAKYLLERGIFARKYFYPAVHKFSPYKEMNVLLPVTEEIAEQVLCLPTGQDINEEIVKFICATISEALEATQKNLI